jgi:hypothetical protein
MNEKYEPTKRLMQELELKLLHQCAYSKLTYNLQMQSLMNVYLILDKHFEKEINQSTNN